MSIENSYLVSLPVLSGLFLIGFMMAFATFQLVIKSVGTKVLLSEKKHPAFTGRQTPQIGGVIIFPVSSLVLLSAIVLVPGSTDENAKYSIVIYSCICLATMTLGLLDDMRPTSPLIRLVFQTFLATAAMTLIASLSDLGMESSFLGLLPIFITVPVCIIGIIWTMNSTNFIDGMDLVTLATLLPGLIFLSGIFMTMGVYPYMQMFSVILLGSLLAFGWFNKPVAQAYLGDAGSLPLGMVAASFITLSIYKFDTLAGLLPFSYLFSDTLTTLWKRVRQRANIFESHSSHAYQIARKNGQSTTIITFKIFAISSICSAIAALAFTLRGSLASELVSLLAASVCGMFLVRNLRNAQQSI